MKLAQKPDSQSFDEYKLSLYSNKKLLELTWWDIATTLNMYKEADRNYTEDYCRHEAKRRENEVKSFAISKSVEATGNETLLNIKKLRIMLSDERSQAAAYVQRDARDDYVKEIAKDCARDLAKSLPLVKPNTATTSTSLKRNDVGILLLSDWHYGLTAHNGQDEELYNPEIAKERVSILQHNIMPLVQQYKKLYVLNLNDLISGRIHTTIRIQNRVDVVTQTLHVSEILAEFLNGLSEVVDIEYCDCYDNHSRVEPDKSKSLSKESFVRFITAFLKERLKSNSKISFMFNEPQDIIDTTICGYSIVAVHGDKDTLESSATDIPALLKKNVHLALTAHRHHFASGEFNRVYALSNGSLMGCDDFSFDLRKSSNPSQLLITLNSNSPVYDIKVIDVSKRYI